MGGQNGGVIINGYIFRGGGDKNIPKLNIVMVVQLHEYAINH
jgi:hypothetical protein